MPYWNKPTDRAPPKTKSELREMLAEAVRNTDPKPTRHPKTEGKEARA